MVELSRDDQYETKLRTTDVPTSLAPTTVFAVLTDKQVPPSSWKARFVMPVPDWTTKRFPAVSNWIDRGFERPVAINATR